MKTPVTIGALAALLLLPFNTAVHAETSARAESKPSATFALECARKEIQVITFIEHHGQTGRLPPDVLSAAMVDQLSARADCYEGRVREALAKYDSILEIGPDPSQAMK